jgi:hypothetical protein
LEDAYNQLKQSTTERVDADLRDKLGEDSALLAEIKKIPSEAVQLSIGNLCLCLLPNKALLEKSSAQVNINDIMALANHFLLMLNNFQLDNRDLMLDGVSTYLSNLSPLYVFKNVEGQPFDASQHQVVHRKNPTSQNDKIHKMHTFLVEHKQSGKTFRHAKVEFSV